MPTEVISTNNIRSIQQTKDLPGTKSVSRRDGDASPFSPQTNVNIKNSITDMVGVLSKISSTQEEVSQLLPQQIRAMVENILRQAFNVEVTLGESLSSTLESQRFSVEQLATLSRILSQLGNISAKEGINSLSTEIQTLLKCFKDLVSKKNSSFEPVLLHKAAFQLLNAEENKGSSKFLEDFFSSVNNKMEFGSFGNSDESLSFLKKLIKAFLPLEQMEGNNQKMLSLGENISQITHAEKEVSNEVNSETKQVRLQHYENSSEKIRAQETVQNNVVEKKDNIQESLTEETIHNNKYVGVEKKVENKEKKDFPRENVGDYSLRTDKKENVFQNTNSLESGINKAQSVLEKLQNLRNQLINNNEKLQTLPQASSEREILSEPFRNSPETMGVLKTLADLVLKDAKLSPKEEVILQAFVNGEQEVLTEKDAKQLQLLLKLCESNVPSALRQVATRNNMPDLPRLWAFMQLCDIAALEEKNPRMLKNNSRNVADFALLMRGKMEGEGSSNPVLGQKSMNFMMPLYLGENEQSYPAYIHVYDENKPQEKSSDAQKETWLRICLLTENIGAVEVTCRIYDKQKLDVRVLFSQRESVDGFKEYVQEFKKSFNEIPLELADLKIGVVRGG